MVNKPTYEELEQKVRELEGKSLLEPKPEAEALQAACYDMEQKMKEHTAELQRKNEELELAASVFEHTIEGIMVTDSDGTIQRVNNAFTFITGYDAEEAIGQNPRILKSDRHAPEFYKEMWDSLINYGLWNGEIWNRRKNGETYPEWLSINAIKDLLGEIHHYVAVFHDITDVKHTEERLAYQAYHDALTGLPNRQLFNDRLKMALNHAARRNQSLGVLYLDLDDFKNINDSLGHHCGDLLLQEVAERLKSCSRDEDTVARLGGDEFMLLLPNIQSREPAAVRVAQRILESLAAPASLEGKEVAVNASIGITIFPLDGDNAETLVKNADMAMYKAKKLGKNRYALYTEKMNQAVLRRITLENDLHKAMQRKEFRVYYQPKVQIKTGIVSGMEALARWQRADGKMVPPSEFIPIAEDIGVIFPLGQWVLLTACQQVKEHHQAGHGDLSVSVNLSTKQFQLKDLDTMVKETLEKTGLPPHFLTLEITENMVIVDVEVAIRTMAKFADMGVRTSIDDFGTGYSSLAYLRQFSLNELKIDKSFIDDIPHNPEAAAIIKSILSLAESLNLKTVAEGIETEEQLEFMRAVGCEEMQGYLFSKPLCAAEFSELLRQGKRLEPSS